MKSNTAFTLIELLVVVLIIGILAAVAVPQYQKTVLKTRYVQALTLGKALKEAVNRYYLANNTFPTELDELDIDLPGTLDVNKRVVRTDKYQCYLDIRGKSWDSIWCELLNLSGVYLSFRWDRDTGNNYCVAIGKRNEEVCKLVGGKNPYDNGTGYMHYRLP